MQPPFMRTCGDGASENIRFLRHFASTQKHQNYLRVISRVYLAGRLNVSLQSSRNVGATASGGLLNPLDVVVPQTGGNTEAVTLDAYSKNIAKLNELINESLKTIDAAGQPKILPGGQVKVVSASASSVSLVETFLKPLVVGYLGFDMVIGTDGRIGAPIPTHSLLKQENIGEIGTTPMLMVLANTAMSTAYRRLSVVKNTDRSADDLVNELDRLADQVLPRAYTCPVYELEDAGRSLGRVHDQDQKLTRSEGFRDLLTYRAELIKSISDIRRVKQNTKVAVQGFPQRTPDVEKQLDLHLRANEEALSTLNTTLANHDMVLHRAYEYAGYIE